MFHRTNNSFTNAEFSANVSVRVSARFRNYEETFRHAFVRHYTWV
jgi:hypothetical protein